MQAWRLLVGSIIRHPMNRGQQVRALARFDSWQARSRFSAKPLEVPFVDDTVLVIGRTASGASGNIYYGLSEWIDMAFVLHVLREGDLFVDVGANLGSYSILAAGAASANVVAIEPIETTLARLRENLAANGLDGRVEVHGAGLGAKPGKLVFTQNADAMNRVATAGQDGREVEVRTLDDILAGRAATVIKIDVEGFEMAVLEGARATLANPELMALVIELNPQIAQYGYPVDAVEQFLSERGFDLVSYDPLARKLLPWKAKLQNGIFVRDRHRIESRLATAKRFRTQARDI